VSHASRLRPRIYRGLARSLRGRTGAKSSLARREATKSPLGRVNVGDFESVQCRPRFSALFDSPFVQGAQRS